MRALKLSLFASTMLLGSFTMTAQTADEVINKHIAAVGGVDAWKKITTLKTSGTTSMQGNEVKISKTMVQNKSMRMDLDIMNMNNYVIMTNTEGWQYFPVMGQTKAEAMPAEAVKQSQAQLDFTDEIIKSKNAGDKAVYVGKDKVDAVECHKLTITDKDGDVSTAFFDAKTGLLVKVSQMAEIQGQKTEVSSSFKDYKKLPEGISIPMAVTSADGDVTWTSVEVNKPVDEKLFKAN